LNYWYYEVELVSKLERKV